MILANTPVLWTTKTRTEQRRFRPDLAIRWLQAIGFRQRARAPFTRPLYTGEVGVLQDLALDWSQIGHCAFGTT